MYNSNFIKNTEESLKIKELNFLIKSLSKYNVEDNYFNKVIVKKLKDLSFEINYQNFNNRKKIIKSKNNLNIHNLNISEELNKLKIQITSKSLSTYDILKKSGITELNKEAFKIFLKLEKYEIRHISKEIDENILNDLISNKSKIEKFDYNSIISASNLLKMNVELTKENINSGKEYLKLLSQLPDEERFKYQKMESEDKKSCYDLDLSLIRKLKEMKKEINKDNFLGIQQLELNSKLPLTEENLDFLLKNHNFLKMLIKKLEKKIEKNKNKNKSFKYEVLKVFNKLPEEIVKEIENISLILLEIETTIDNKISNILKKETENKFKYENNSLKNMFSNILKNPSSISNREERINQIEYECKLEKSLTVKKESVESISNLNLS